MSEEALVALSEIWFDADQTTSNRVTDGVLCEFRTRPVIQSRLRSVPLPDFDAGDARVLSPKFWDLNAVYREGDALMRCRPRSLSGHTPWQVQLQSRIACRDVKFQCDFAYSCFKGQVALSFERVIMNVILAVDDGVPSVQSLQVENIGDFEVCSLLGVPGVLKWLAAKVIKKVIRENNHVIVRLASHEVKDVLQEAVSDQNLESVILAELSTTNMKHIPADMLKGAAS